MGLVNIRRLSEQKGTNPPVYLPPYFGKGVPGSMVEPGETVPVEPKKAKQLLRDFPQEWELVPSKDGFDPDLGDGDDTEDVKAILEGLQVLTGVGPTAAQKLYNRGFTSPASVLAESRDNLSKIVGPLTAKRILSTELPA